MNMQLTLKKSLTELRLMRNPYIVLFLMFLMNGSFLSIGQTETRTALQSTSATTTTEKAKLEYQQTENPEKHWIYTKILLLDVDIRHFLESKQMPIQAKDQYLMKLSSLCSECLVNGVLQHEMVYNFIGDPNNSSALLGFMEEFLTNLSNQ
jgi:hypothetical protein